MKDLKEKLVELKALIGETDEQSIHAKEAILAELRQHQDDAEVQQALADFVDGGLSEIEQDIKHLRTQIENEYELLPLAYIAKEYFKKSRAWLYQRLNGYEVRGRIYTLSDKEKQIFNDAVQEIAQRIGSVHLA